MSTQVISIHLIQLTVLAHIADAAIFKERRRLTERCVRCTSLKQRLRLWIPKVYRPWKKPKQTRSNQQLACIPSLNNIDVSGALVRQRRKLLICFADMNVTRHVTATTITSASTFERRKTISSAKACLLDTLTVHIRGSVDRLLQGLLGEYG